MTPKEFNEHFNNFTLSELLIMMNNLNIKTTHGLDWTKGHLTMFARKHNIKLRGQK